MGDATVEFGFISSCFVILLLSSGIDNKGWIRPGGGWPDINRLMDAKGCRS